MPLTLQVSQRCCEIGYIIFISQLGRLRLKKSCALPKFTQLGNCRAVTQIQASTAPRCMFLPSDSNVFVGLGQQMEVIEADYLKKMRKCVRRGWVYLCWDVIKDLIIGGDLQPVDQGATVVSTIHGASFWTQHKPDSYGLFVNVNCVCVRACMHARMCGTCRTFSGFPVGPISPQTVLNTVAGLNGASQHSLPLASFYYFPQHLSLSSQTI